MQQKLQSISRNLVKKMQELKSLMMVMACQKKDVKEKWMVIGTNSRLHDDKIKNGKAAWGEMGIGRMACQKLGSMTELVSVKNKEQIKMTFDWSVFERSGVTVDKITFPVEAGSSENMEHGLTLEITNLKSQWTSKKNK